MTLRDVLEYRAADSDTITLSLDDIPRHARTIYSRPWGAQQWGYHSGELYWDHQFTPPESPA